MSIHHPKRVSCPNCQQEQTVTIWDTLNADVSPEARESLLRAEINAFVCSACGERIEITTPLMYHDMKRQFIVQFLPFGALQDMSFIERFDTDGSDRIAKETFTTMPEKIRCNETSQYLRYPHTVFSMGELVRYVVFREKLFDASVNRRGKL
jgi:hypothetical protein